MIETAKTGIASNSPLSKESLYFLLPFLLVGLPLAVIAYGSDVDTYLVLDAGRNTWQLSKPSMSRHPGYWLFEALTYFVSGIGGHVLTNVLTLLIAAIILQRFFNILVRNNVAHPVLMTLCLGLNPTFLVSATSTMDYVWALLALVLCAELLIRRNWALAGLCAGLAIGFRLGSAFPLAGIFVGFLWANPSLARFRFLILAALIATAIGVASYYPSWVLVGRNLSFLAPNLLGAQYWTFKMHAGRFVYKTLYLYGLLTFVALVGIVLYASIKKQIEARLSEWGAMALGASVATIGLFAKYPIEFAYLLPFLFFFYVLYCLQVRLPSRIPALVLLVTTVSYCIVSLPLARPNVPTRATDAKIGLSVTEGVLIEEARERRAVAACASDKCWVEHNIEYPQPH